MSTYRPLAVALIVLLAAVAGGAALTTAQESPPGEPANFYGNAVDENGNGAPVGTTIAAVVDGEVEGEITVDTTGEYGEEDAFGTKLSLNSGAGDTVVFHVNGPAGPEALESPQDLESGTHELDLTFPVGTFEDEPAVESITLDLDDETIEEGDETTATVTATFDDSSTEDVTDEATIGSDDTSVATVDGATVTGESEGTATIEAEHAGETDSVELTVEEEDDPSPSPSPSPDPDEEPEVIDDPEELEEIIEPPEDVPPTRAEQASITINEETGQAQVVFTENSSTESITFADDDVEGDVTVAEYETESDETGPSPGTSVSVSQITVPDPDRSATIRNRVSTERLEEVNADADELRINRFVDGEWQGLETEVADADDDRVVLQAETPGFSWFSVSAVSEPEATFEVIPAEPEVGDEVTFDASDSDDRHGEIEDYEWTINGDQFSGETVTYTFEEAGDYEVVLTIESDTGETATHEETVSVMEEEEPPEEEPPEDEPPEDDSSLLLVVVGAIVVIGAVVAVFLWQRDGLNMGEE